MPATRIIEHFQTKHCVPALEGETREAVIEELAQTFVDSGAIGEGERDMLLESVLERESAATTGVGNGTALPHPKRVEDVADYVDGILVAVGLHRGGIDFRASDGEPVHIVFLVASSDNLLYLEVAKRIAVLAKGGALHEKWRRVILQSETPAAIREALEDAWDELAP